MASGGLLDPLAGPGYASFPFQLCSTTGWSFSFFLSGVRLLSPRRLRLLSLSLGIFDGVDAVSCVDALLNSGVLYSPSFILIRTACHDKS